MYLIKDVETTLIILSTIISFYILKIAFLILKQRSALKQLDGFQGTGHWFSGPTSDIRKIGKVDLMKTFPHYFKFPEGLLRYRISCYDPHVIRHVIHNSVKATERFHIAWLTYMGDNCIDSKPIGPDLKAYKQLIHKYYALHSQQHFIKICREVCMSSLQNLDISDQEVKAMDTRSCLSGIEYNLPMKLWMGETTIEFKKNLVNILGYEEGNHIKPDYTNLLDYWQTPCQTLEAFRNRKRIEQVHSKVLAIHRNKILNSRNRKNIDHSTSIIDQVIRLEMMGNHTMS